MLLISMGFILAIFGGLAALLGLTGRKGDSLPIPTPPKLPPSMERDWGPLVKTLASVAGIPYAFAMQWMKHESGGNPCATGRLDQFGPAPYDKLPREMGLFQLYNLDDFKAFKIDPNSFRAYCIPGTQKQSRPLTDTEKRDQVNAGILLIKKQEKRATDNFAKHGMTWSPTSPDYWMMVKLGHGIPGFVSTGLTAVVKTLGHAPKTWLEFKQSMLSKPTQDWIRKLDSGTAAKIPIMAKVLDNAEKAGSAVSISQEGIV